ILTHPSFRGASFAVFRGGPVGLLTRTLPWSALVVAFAASAAPGEPTWDLPGAHAVHEARQIGAIASVPRQPAPLPAVTAGPDVIVYGYLAYWANDLATVPWDQLSHLAIFTAEATPAGALTNTSRWSLTEDALEIAALYGVRVHLCVTNFEPDEL